MSLEDTVKFLGERVISTSVLQRRTTVHVLTWGTDFDGERFRQCACDTAKYGNTVEVCWPPNVGGVVDCKRFSTVTLTSTVFPYGGMARQA